MNLSPDEITPRARLIRLLLTDCDGVLTDGSLHYSSDGERAVEATQVFHIHDGLGIRLAHAAGLKVGIISGRTSLPLAHRARELKIDHLYQGIADKLDAYKQICAAEGLLEEQIAYLGDDLPDLPLLRRAGLAVAVADAVSEVQLYAHHITQRRGGRGAMRETIELILRAQGKWKEIIRQYEAT